MTYKQIHVGNLSMASLKKAAKGGTLTIPKDKMTGDRVMLVHPLNHKAYQKAKKLGHGCRLYIAPGEIDADLEYHATHGGSLHGGFYGAG